GEAPGGGEGGDGGLRAGGVALGAEETVGAGEDPRVARHPAEHARVLDGEVDRAEAAGAEARDPAVGRAQAAVAAVDVRDQGLEEPGRGGVAERGVAPVVGGGG